MRTLSPLVAASLLLAGGCTVGPDFKSPSWASPSTWLGHGPAPRVHPASLAVTEPIDTKWWNQFQDPELTSLMERVAAGNLDVRLATVRLAESRSQRGIAA